MKKLLFFATVVGVAFTGCVSDNEAILTSKDNAKTITFEVAKFKTSSRAEGDGTQIAADGNYSELGANERFGTFAYYANGFNTTHEPFMVNEQIGKIGDYWAAIGETFFWPESGHVDFISYYPYKTANGAGTYPAGVPVIGHSNATTNDYNKLEYKNYTVGTEDLMYSDKAHYQTHNYKTYFYAGVPTLFNHALAKLNFHVTAKDVRTTEGTTTIDWQVIVKSITIDNIYNTGSVELTTNSPASENGQYKPQTTKWTNASGNNVWSPTTAKISKTWSVTGGQELHMKSAVFGDAKDYFVLPQSLYANDQSLTIEYTIANKASTSTTYGTPDEFTKKLYFKDYTAAMKDAWEMGTNIIYNIVIDPKGDVINFDPVVTDWVDVNGTIDI